MTGLHGLICHPFKGIVAIIPVCIGFSLLMGTFVMPAAAQEPEGRVIVVSPRVGEVIDAGERERFGLFPMIHTFHSARFLLLPDSALVADVTLMENGVERTQRIRLPKTMLTTIRETIEHFEESQAGTHRMTPRQRPTPPQLPSRKGSGAGRVAAQLVVGSLTGGLGSLVGIGALAASCGDDDCSDSQVIASLGLMYGLNALVSAATVYGIGKHHDRAGHGSPGATAGGALVGMTLAALTLPSALESNGPELFILSLTFPAIGAVIGYNMSLPQAPGVLNIRDGRIQWGIPTPTLQATRLPHKQSALDYRVRLVDVRF
ncbi:MAG: hypothetical protein HY710_04025 [Candidatus Latescibacteria bacterium]|nr:hypothetical protein [Candidatus Latescibacterota bacterium]